MENTLHKPIHCVELLDCNDPPVCSQQGETLISSERVRKAAELVNMCLATAAKMLHLRKKQKKENY